MPPLIQVQKVPSSLEAETIAHLARLGYYTPTLSNALDVLIKTLKTNDVWNYLDLINVPHNNEADSLLNLKGSTYDSTNVNGATFIADQGFNSVALGTDGSNPGYLDTNLIVNGTTLVSDDDNSMFVYQRTTQSTTGVYLLGTLGINPFAMFYDGGAATDVQMFMSNLWSIPNVANDAAIGFIGGTRRSNVDADIRVNGVNTNTNSTTTNTPINANSLFVGCQNTTGTPSNLAIGHQISAWGVGGGLTVTQHAALESSIQTFMTAIGSEV